jgi:hypothetical protein
MSTRWQPIQISSTVLLKPHYELNETSGTQFTISNLHSMDSGKQRVMGREVTKETPIKTTMTCVMETCLQGLEAGPLNTKQGRQ